MDSFEVNLYSVSGNDDADAGAVMPVLHECKDEDAVDDEADLVIHEAVLAVKDKPMPALLLRVPRPHAVEKRRKGYTIPGILAWAEGHYGRTGRWPKISSGAIPQAPGETWNRVNNALRAGRRGLAGVGSLARLLDAYRGVYNHLARPHFSIETILGWADAYHARRGRWPISSSGRISGQRHETWEKVDAALSGGCRGLPGGSSLAKLLHTERGAMHRLIDREITEEQVLEWADAHHERTGRWPKADSGPIAGREPETWSMVERALYFGIRGLPGGSSLFRILAEHRGAPRLQGIPPLTFEIILAWADAHYERTGRLPVAESGVVTDAPNETWLAINQALHDGHRGLPGGCTLPRLLAEYRSERTNESMRKLSIDQILTWADAHFARTGVYPTRGSGAIEGAPGNTWQAIDDSLKEGRRGLPGGTTLVKLLAEHRDRYSPKSQRRVTVDMILGWAEAHYCRTGSWPTSRSGGIPEAPGETWKSIHVAMRYGKRGLPERMTLLRLLAERGVQTPASRPDLAIELVLMWADAHRGRTGRWPNTESGAVAEAPNTTWAGINMSLHHGYRGLPGGCSLSQLLKAKRSQYEADLVRPLSIDQILEWADSYFARVGAWPVRTSGAVPESLQDSWAAIHEALREGRRGLPGGSTLVKLLAEHRGRHSPRALSDLTLEQILCWAEQHHKRTGLWPATNSGAVNDAPRESWYGIARALRLGRRGLPAGVKLTTLLTERYGRYIWTAMPDLAIEQVLGWADEFRSREGRWPDDDSGKVFGGSVESWRSINNALSLGNRGLPGATTLVEFLVKHRGRRSARYRPKLNKDDILTWADAYHDRTGKWPNINSGVFNGNENWKAIAGALRVGQRGLPGGSSLAKLLAEERGAFNLKGRPPLTEELVIELAVQYKMANGSWPTLRSGPIASLPYDSWESVLGALSNGIRGLSRRTTLARLLRERGVV